MRKAWKERAVFLGYTFLYNKPVVAFEHFTDDISCCRFWHDYGLYSINYPLCLSTTQAFLLN